ncbi:MAG TPA: RNB domain-containing ribonuclease [Miltoncostaeaceae bacterium]|jgi:exoribonuclease R|nr:RNB domain-containing ribonuclease [Miltoncostaeaceae bacterium]
MRLEPGAAGLAAGFDGIREELGVPGAFPPDAEAEAQAATVPPAGPDRADRRDLELVTIDPPGSRDLDQALHIARRGDGFRVSYAIADVAALVAPGGAVDREARARGVTVYMPDSRSPLHPEAIGEGAGSLLPDADRGALLWTIDVDGRGEPVAVGVERALVRSRRALGYAEVQGAIDAGSADGTLSLLREVGELRLAREAERGGVSLTVPVQEVAPAAAGGYVLRFEATLPVEDWNAQVSLLTGMAAARIMIDGGIGLFRTLEPADERDVASLRRSAVALGVDWPEGTRYADVVRGLDPRRPADAAFAVRAARLFRGAGYTAWRRDDGPAPAHAAIAAPYAHVTAPLRRLCDRVANEVVLALAAGTEPPRWALEALDEVPERMAETTRRARDAERAAVDQMEAILLAPRIGQDFDGVVTDVRDDRATVQIADPAVVAPLDGDGVEPGTRVRVRLSVADPEARKVRFTLVGA